MSEEPSDMIEAGVSEADPSCVSLHTEAPFQLSKLNWNIQQQIPSGRPSVITGGLFQCISKSRVITERE